MLQKRPVKAVFFISICALFWAAPSLANGPRRCLQRLLHVPTAQTHVDALYTLFFEDDQWALHFTDIEMQLLRREGDHYALKWRRFAPREWIQSLIRNYATVFLESTGTQIRVKLPATSGVQKNGLIAADMASGVITLTYAADGGMVWAERFAFETGNTLSRLAFDTGDRPVLVRVSADRRFLAVTTQSDHLEIWDFATGHLLKRQTVDQSHGVPLTLQFIEGSQRLVFTTSPVFLPDGTNGFLGVVDLRDLDLPTAYYAHPEPGANHVDPARGRWMNEMEVFNYGGKTFAGFSYFEPVAAAEVPVLRRHWILDLGSSPHAPVWSAWRYHFGRAVSSDNRRWLTQEGERIGLPLAEDGPALKCLDPATGEILGRFPKLPTGFLTRPQAISNDGRYAVLAVGTGRLNQFWIFELNADSREYEWKGALDRIQDWPEEANYQSPLLGNHRGAQLREAFFSPDQTRVVATAEGRDLLTRSVSVKEILERGTTFPLADAFVRVSFHRESSEAQTRVIRRLEAVAEMRNYFYDSEHTVDFEFSGIPLANLVTLLEEIARIPGVKGLR